MTPETTSILFLAADRIEFKGWCQDRFGNEEVGMCGERALVRESADLGLSLTEYGEASQVVTRLLKRLMPDKNWCLINYNDTKGRTAHEVAHLLRAAALEDLFA